MRKDPRPPLLYMVHRIPYPPNKGDKVRSFNILRELAERYRVYLGTFVDHPDDQCHIERLREWCAGSYVANLAPRRARLASLAGLFGGEALSLPYYRDAGLYRWVVETIEAQGIRQALAFSGPMAQYLVHPAIERAVVDFCDLDSAKWSQYGREHPWPLSWLYRREGECLLAFERRVAAKTDFSLFVTEAEAALFAASAPESAEQIRVMRNGVDADFFSPQHAHSRPYPDASRVVLFTGAMDYWPNIDAVTWFAGKVLPALRERHPNLEFWIVGMNPAPAVRALAGGSVVVTGTVPDVRPYLAHAEVVVAPMRIARGVQNKVLEAMAMARPVVVSKGAGKGLDAEPGRDYVVAGEAAEFVERIDGLLVDTVARSALADAARTCVIRRYSWQAHLSVLPRLLELDNLTPASSLQSEPAPMLAGTGP